MKLSILTFILFGSLVCFGQAENSIEAEDTYTIVDKTASFPGGHEMLQKYLKNELVYPQQALEMSIEGNVFVQMIIEKDGSFSEAKVVKGIGSGCDEEAMRLINKMPNWIAGEIEGKTVRQKFIQRINFNPSKSFSQVPDSIPTEEETFVLIENSASFPGGLQAWGRYISKNLKYPNEAKKKRIEGRVYVQFIVEKDGSLSDIKVVKSLGSGCDEEALRVVKMMPKWEPATQKGIPVRQKMIQNILFKSF